MLAIEFLDDTKADVPAAARRSQLTRCLRWAESGTCWVRMRTLPLAVRWRTGGREAGLGYVV